MMIREAQHADVPRVATMAQSFHASAAKEEGPSLPFDLNMAKNALHAALASPAANVWIAERDGEAVGFLGAVIAPTIFGPAALAQEFAFWVDPSSRGGSAAKRLITAYEAWAREKGATALGLVAREERTSVLYRRSGYEPAETHFWKAF